MGPDNQMLFTRKAKGEGVFYFKPNLTGTYTFIFNNRKVIFWELE